MKQISLLLVLLIAGTLSSFAQKSYKKTFAGKKIEISLGNGSLKLAGYDGNEVTIEADNLPSPPPERAKGLKPLYKDFTDNTGIGLEIKELGSVLKIQKAAPDWITYTIRIPRNMDLKVEATDWRCNQFELRDLNGEVEVMGKMTTMQIANITGPVVANTINGSITAVFSKINQDKPTDLVATNGFVDVSLPSDTKANVELYSINGKVYSDFDVKIDGEKSAASSNTIRDIGTINGGGVALSMRSINEHVYLRKK